MAAAALPGAFRHSRVGAAPFPIHRRPPRRRVAAHAPWRRPAL